MLAINSNPISDYTVWVIDSGASHHMCNDKNLFLKRSVTTTNYTIKLGDKTTVNAELAGLVPFYGQTLHALLVPGFRVSLLSVSQLDEHLKWSTSFAHGTCQIRNQQNALVLQVPRTDGLYRLKTSGTADSLQATHETGSSDPLAIWHQRLAHPHQSVLRRLLPDVQASTEVSNCDVCIKAKMKQKFERNPVPRSTKPFELIHSDLCGPMPSSLGGARYYILYIDDCTRYVECYLLVTKSASEIQAKFEIYKAWVEGQGFQIRRFRSDNGTGEYQNSAFLQTLALSGISFEPAPPYTQHKNGVAERMIQTLNSKARCLLLDAELPTKFWGESIKTSVYIHRRTPTSSLEGHRSPFEALYGTRPPVHHLRRFGCKVYRHLPEAQRIGKFAERARECMMLGYVHKTTKIYRIWDFNGRGRAIESSNVYFIESQNAWTNRSVDSEALDTLFPNDDESDQTTQEVDHGTAKFPGPSGQDNGANPGQDPLLLSRDSHVIPPSGENQPADRNANIRLRDTEMSPNNSKSKPQNPEARQSAAYSIRLRLQELPGRRMSPEKLPQGCVP